MVGYPALPAPTPLGSVQAGPVPQAAIRAGQLAPRNVFVSPSGRRYAFIETNEPGTEEELRREIAALPPAARAITAADRDSFIGHDRKAAKTSSADGDAQEFSTLGDLLNALPADQSMLSHDPPISKDADSDRVTEEQKNVTVTAYIYAAKFESDNDYHVILGTDSAGGIRSFMNAEISGLPRTGPARGALTSVRDQFKQFFASNPLGTSYRLFDPPIAVRVTGSLFYDIDHAPGVVGPSGHRPKTAWEIHPVTGIDFEVQ